MAEGKNWLSAVLIKFFWFFWRKDWKNGEKSRKMKSSENFYEDGFGKISVNEGVLCNFINELQKSEEKIWLLH